jgi:S1-C subfamily serine protease
MFCKHCGKEIQEGVKFCKYCGQKIIEEKPEEKPEPTNTFSFKQPPFHFLLLYVFTFGIYGIYWFYRIWRQIKEHTKATFSPGWRTVGLFIPIYNIWSIYTLFNDVKSLRIKAGFTENPSPGWLTLGYIVLGVLYRLPGAWWLLGFLSIFPLLSIQKALNEYWEKEQKGRREKTKFSAKEIVVLVIGAIFLALSLWGTFISEIDYQEFFSYLGKESIVINSIQQKLSQQPSGFCCSDMPSSEIDYYLKEIPSELYSKKEKNAEQIFEDFSKAVVTIGGETYYGEFGFGSAFLISPSGLLVTNYHVIEDMHKLAVALKNETIQLFDVNLIVAEDPIPIKDIAVLKIQGQNLPFVVMGDSDLVKPGQKVFAIGNPEGYTNTISEGIISQIREFTPGINSFQITAPISQGSSGGALFNTKGEVIGITNMIDWYGQNINFAVPINYVKDLIGLKE